MKKTVVLLVCVVMVFSFWNLSVLADDGIKVTLNGSNLEFDVPPQLVDNRTMVPLRKIFEAMGAVVEWEDATKTVTATKNNERVIATVNSKNAYISGNTIVLDVPPLIIDNRTLVPIRFVAEAFGASVKWDEATKTVIIVVKWDGIGKVPCYQAYPNVPDFGAINGIADIGGKSNRGFIYDINQIDINDIYSYLDILEKSGFKVKIYNSIVTCQKGNTCVDIALLSDSVTVLITQQ